MAQSDDDKRAEIARKKSIQKQQREREQRQDESRSQRTQDRESMRSTLERKTKPSERFREARGKSSAGDVRQARASTLERIRAQAKRKKDHTFDTGATSPMGKMIDQAGAAVVERASGQSTSDIARAEKLAEIRAMQDRVRAERRNRQAQMKQQQKMEKMKARGR